MKAAGRKILLLYANAPVHEEPEEELTQVEIARLPKNTTVSCNLWARVLLLGSRQGS
ncbi:hypothetical protein PR001_g20569 [Phytophthora rubi]|uniref:DDE-1 domain-containing protein n=1 Tax=Phytophthora rubi TaxID=129364 RepID=A0A6A3JF79_9STRA|nr:hypothetical protein PR002_g29459 [Phytophthora rubi]KAE8993819.1 hypothetical protein PR001_g20569 [Phytophthora rubi]